MSKSIEIYKKESIEVLEGYFSSIYNTFGVSLTSDHKKQLSGLVDKFVNIAIQTIKEEKN